MDRYSILAEETNNKIKPRLSNGSVEEVKDKSVLND